MMELSIFKMVAGGKKKIAVFEQFQSDPVRQARMNPEVGVAADQIPCRVKRDASVAATATAAITTASTCIGRIARAIEPGTAAAEPAGQP